MSFKVFFDFSVGFSKTLYFCKGTYKRVLEGVNATERRLKIRRQYCRGACRWNNFPLVDGGISNEEYCDAVEKHNSLVEWFYEQCSQAPCEPQQGREEAITPGMASNLFIGLRQLTVRPERWTYEYYQSRMEAMYDTLRGRPREGMIFDSEPLSIEQARDVIVIFAQYLDSHDIRLDVCRGHDSLTNSYSEGYFWCDQCGAISYDDLPYEFDTNNDRCDKCQAAAASVTA